ncbi:MAG: efflux RND transporter periplasmic adaptor subunit [Gallionella sp.]|nr:efflux RND transporter periplasmic adaptor subunit [Gallionella sp.]
MKFPIHSRTAWGLLILAGLVAVGLLYRTATPSVQTYRLETIESGEIRQSVSANGTLNPVSLISVGTQVSGTVRKIHVDFNSKVEKGQLLLELDDAMLAAQQRQSNANVLSAAASLELATANEVRMRDLFSQEFVSRQELDTAVQAKKTAAAQLQAARATADKDKANLSYSLIRSPVSGIVVDRSVDVGQTVAASLQTPTLFKIAQDLSKMQIDANFAEADIGNIRVGQTAQFNVDAFPDRGFQGIVRQIRLNPTTTQNVVTYDVVIDVNNPGQVLLPGMTAYVSIVVAERSEILLLPNAALRFKPTTSAEKSAPRTYGGKEPQNGKNTGFPGRVFVLREGKPQAVSVTLGITDNRHTELIDSPLKPGDQVIVGEAMENNSGTSSPMRMRMF